MAGLIEIRIKLKDGSYKKYTVAFNDTSSQFGTNAEMFESQTKEERLAKVPKRNRSFGKVFWTNGVCKLAEKPEQVQSEDIFVPKELEYKPWQSDVEINNLDDLPF